MKLTLSVIFAASTFSQNTDNNSTAPFAHPRQSEGITKWDTDRRYNQLTSMMNHYNPNFDIQKYWSYGCNCLLMGDRPMSSRGEGAPVDALDTVCRAYKDCQQCARMIYGDQCIGEFTRYRFKRIVLSNGQEDVECKSKPDTCEQALCQCDKQFARDHGPATASFNIAYHAFWGGFDSSTQCNPAHPGRNVGDQKMCCRNFDKSGVFTMYKPNTHHCCDSGKVHLHGDMC